MDKETREAVREIEQSILAKVRELRQDSKQERLEAFIGKIADSQSKYSKEAKALLEEHGNPH